MTHRLSACAAVTALFATCLPVYADSTDIDPVLERVLEAFGHDAAVVDGVSWQSRTRSEDGEFVYRDLILKDGNEALTASELVVSGSPQTGPVQIAADDISVKSDMESVSIDFLSMDFDPEVLASLDDMDRSGAGPEPMDVLCRLATSGFKLNLSGFEAEHPSGSSLLAGNFHVGLKAKTMAQRCLGLLNVGISDFSFEQNGESASFGNLMIASLQLFDRDLIERPTGIDYQSRFEVTDIEFDIDSMPAPVSVDRFFSINRTSADSMIDLAQSDFGQLMSLAALSSLKPVTPGQAPFSPELIDTAELWNAVREISSDGRIAVEGLRTDFTDLSALPQSSPMRGPVDLTAEFGVRMNAGTVSIDLNKEVSPLADLAVDLVLELGEAQQSEADMPPEFMLMRLPLKLKKFAAEFDEKGLDEVLRQMTGRGLQENVAERMTMLQPDQKALLSDWLAASIGDGNSATLILEPDQPQIVQSLAPMLFGDWSLLGEVLNARTSH